MPDYNSVMDSSEPLAPISDDWSRRKLFSVLIAVRRVIVLCTGTIALYIILGTFTDRLWWYGFFWDGHDRAAYMIEGVRWLIDQAFWLTLGILIALAIAAGVGRYFRRHVWKVIDSVPWTIVIFACLAVATDALVLRHTMATTYAAQTSSL